MKRHLENASVWSKHGLHVASAFAPTPRTYNRCRLSYPPRKTRVTHVPRLPAPQCPWQKCTIFDRTLKTSLAYISNSYFTPPVRSAEYQFFAHLTSFMPPIFRWINDTISLSSFFVLLQTGFMISSVQMARLSALIRLLDLFAWKIARIAREALLATRFNLAKWLVAVGVSSTMPAHDCPSVLRFYDALVVFFPGTSGFLLAAPFVWPARYGVGALTNPLIPIGFRVFVEPSQMAGVWWTVGALPIIDLFICHAWTPHFKSRCNLLNELCCRALKTTTLLDNDLHSLLVSTWL